MGHQITALGTADLSAMLGLITLADAIDLPEGASPRTYNTDYDVGSVFTRAGLESVYTFASPFDYVAGPFFGSLASTTENDDSPYHAGWAGPSLANANTSGVYATALADPGDQTWFMNLTGYGFSTSGVIFGIKVTFNALVTGQNASTMTVVTQLVYNGVAVGNPKQQSISTTNVPYSLGDYGDLWGGSWTHAEINAASFGVQIYVIGGPVTSTANINNVQIAVAYQTSELNFNYIKSYVQNTGQLFTFTLDSSGNLWAEDVVSDPGVLTGFTALRMPAVFSGSYGQSSTSNDQEYLMFSIPTQAVVNDEPTLITMGYDRPRVASETATGSGVSGLQFLPHSPVGPGSTPTFSSVSLSATNGYFTITEYSITSNLVTVTYSPVVAGTLAQAGQLLFLSAASAPSPAALTDIIIFVNPNSATTPLTATTFTFYYEASNASGVAHLTAYNPYVVDISNLDQNWDYNGFYYMGTTYGFPGGNGWTQAATLGGDQWKAQVQSTNSTEFSGDSSTKGTSGNVVSVFYENVESTNPPSPVIHSLDFNTLPIYVQVRNGIDDGNGVWLVSGEGYSTPPSDSDNFWYFGYQVNGVLYADLDINNGAVPGNYWVTRATLVSAEPMLGVANGDTFTIIGADDANSNWNGEWTVITSNAYVLDITSSRYLGTGASPTGLVRFDFSVQTGDVSGIPPTQPTGWAQVGGSPGLTNIYFAAPIPVFNGQGIYFTGTGTSLDGHVWTVNIGYGQPTTQFQVWNPLMVGSGSFPSTAYVLTINTMYGSSDIGSTTLSAGQFVTVSGSTANGGVYNRSGYIYHTDGQGFMEVFLGELSGTSEQEEVLDTGQITVNGNIFIFDPGSKVANQLNSTAYYGPYTGTTAHIYLTNPTLSLLASGVRQGVVYFIKKSGYETAPCPPGQFVVGPDTVGITASDIPIGPSDTIARGFAFTEAGQNGIPGANFYVIRQPVTITDSFTQQAVTYSSTILYDNTSRSVTFNFTDAVLLAADEIDVQGNDLFNLIELGASAWCVPYASRMFYGLQLAKVNNFLNYSFCGGTQSASAPLQPTGWINYTGYANDAELVDNTTSTTIFPGETALLLGTGGGA
jgi:hypothetical protein